jgi:type IV pilus assembly protein PilW
MKKLRGRMGTLLSDQRGVSIIEMLVALAISLVLAAGIYQVFVGSTTSYSLNEDLSRLQENGRFAMYTLRREVTGAGFLGCFQDINSVTSTLKNSDSFTFRFTEAVYGLEATGDNVWADNESGVNPAATGTGSKNLNITDPVSGSDILVMRGVDPDLSVVMESPIPNPSISADMKVPNGTPGIYDNDILMITDCEHASIFQVTNYTQPSGNIVHAAPGGCNPAYGANDYPCNDTKDLGHVYEAGAEIYRPRTVVIYVRDNGAGHLSLYRKVGVKPVEELVEGVENMQVRYGVDTTGDRAADEYLAADALSDWSRVVSVRIRLLMRTVDDILRGPVDTNTYDVDGDGVAEYNPPADRRMRQVVGGTMGLRNRLR